MSNSSDCKGLINSQFLGIDCITIPIKNLAVAEHFYVGVLGGKVMFRIDSYEVAPKGHQLIPYFSVVIGNSPRLNLFLQVWGQSNACEVHPHIAFKVKEDLMTWQALLNSKGIPTDGPKSVRLPRQASLYFNDPFGNHLELCTSNFPGAMQLSSPPREALWHIPNDICNRSLNNVNRAQLLPCWKPTNLYLSTVQGLETTTTADNTFLVSYRQRWEQEIYNRFQEARQRYSEFFPCFELKEDPVEGLQYSIHFKPLTQYAKTLVYNAPLFPRREEFKPIEQLWNEDGQSQLDIIFERFPTQSALKLPKEPWASRCRELFLGLVNQGLELMHIRALVVQKNV